MSVFTLISCNKEDNNDPNAGLSNISNTSKLKYS